MSMFDYSHHFIREMTNNVYIHLIIISTIVNIDYIFYNYLFYTNS